MRDVVAGHVGQQDLALLQSALADQSLAQLDLARPVRVSPSEA